MAVATGRYLDNVSALALISAQLPASIVKRGWWMVDGVAGVSVKLMY